MIALRFRGSITCQVCLAVLWDNGVMTLVLALNTPHTIWMLADRRLSYGGGKFKDSGCKLMVLETSDGVALLGYAGLGATAGGMQPSDWMSNVLRGQPLPLEAALEVLAEAVRRQFPRHLMRFPSGVAMEHVIVVPAFVGGELRTYSIDVALGRDRKTVVSGVRRHVRSKGSVTIRACLAGSGAVALANNKHQMTMLRRLAKAHDEGKVAAEMVANEFAKLNVFVHDRTMDGSVGRTCIVAWKYSKEGVHQGGGGQLHYTGTQKDSASPAIPTLVGGMDVRAIVTAMMPYAEDQFRRLAAGEEAPMFDASINAELSRLPSDPDEHLR